MAHKSCIMYVYGLSLNNHPKDNNDKSLLLHDLSFATLHIITEVQVHGRLMQENKI